MSEQINEQEELSKLYDLQGIIMIRVLRGESHRNVRRSMKLSLKEYIKIMGLTKLDLPTTVEPTTTENTQPNI